jgi:predicted NBD/HSP70 family sugar kinase
LGVDRQPDDHSGCLSVVHAASDLGRVVVDAYNAELRDADGFIGDRASNRRFRAIVDELRERIRDVAHEDPLGDTPTNDFSKKELDKLLIEGDPEAAGIVHGAIEALSAELATVITGLVRSKEWRRTERIVVGGGLRASRIGELVAGRTSVLLKAAGHGIDVVPIHHHPDEAGLVGAVYLVPEWMLAGHDGILAIDIGGSNVRVGVVELHWKKKEPDLAKCEVIEKEQWRYADCDAKPTRDEAVAQLGEMLTRCVRWAEKHELTLAPFIGVACPGVIADSGHIDRGGQNLPGNWESARFNLPRRIREALPRIDDQDVIVVMHNDAVVQGLSEWPFIQDVKQWGVLTIGTGLGNARFTNRRKPG